MNTQEHSVMRQALGMLKDAIRANQHDMIMTGEECRKAESVAAKAQAQLEAVGADCESWYKQNQQSIDDANKFGDERMVMQQALDALEATKSATTSLMQVPDAIYSLRQALAADCALQASHIAVPATDGWVLVPLEPTAEMLQAGQEAPVSESDEDAPEDYKAVYRAMLATAPRHHQAARVPMTGQCFDGDWSADYQHPALQRAERQPMTMDQADDLLQNRKLHGGVLIDLVRDVEKHHGIGSESQQVAEPSSQAEAKGDACGGCGETDGNKRCLGCMHPPQ